MFICRTCGGFANPDTSSDLFAADQRELLKYIQINCNVTIRPLDNLPTHICKNCEAEVIYPAKFVKRYANAQFFFSTSAYNEKLKLMERYKSLPYTKSPKLLNEKVEDAGNDATTTMNSDAESDMDMDKSTSSTKFVDYEEIPILTSKDIFKPRKKNKRGKSKAAKRQMYKCEQCGKLIIDRHNFISHVKRHYGLKPYKCELCPNKYYSNSELKRHNYRHINYKPYKCQYCDTSYFTKGCKDRHERSAHTGEKPYICETCGKTFSGRRNLRNHTKTHTGEKPFACLPCNKTFQRSGQRETHYKSNAHKEKCENKNM